MPVSPEDIYNSECPTYRAEYPHRIYFSRLMGEEYNVMKEWIKAQGIDELDHCIMPTDNIHPYVPLSVQWGFRFSDDAILFRLRWSK